MKNVTFLSRVLWLTVPLLSFLAGCAEHPPFVLMEREDIKEGNHSAYLVWDRVTHFPDGTAVPSEGVLGYRVYYGPVSRFAPGWEAYPYQHDAGKLTGYIVPPVLTGVKRWYFAAKSYSGAAESAYSDEVSKLVE